MRLCDQGAANLVVEIVKQAISDYRFAQAMLRAGDDRRAELRKRSSARSPKAVTDPAEEMRMLEKFFTGKWFHLLVDLDGRELVRLLQTTRRGPQPEELRRKRKRGAPRGRHPGAVTDWQSLARKWPDLQDLAKRLDAQGITKTRLARVLGVDTSTLNKNIQVGTERTKQKVIEAAEKVMREGNRE